MYLQTLSNGLTFCIVPNNLTPLVCIQTWVHAGSLHEESHQRGMAHLIEHMLFKGTQKRGVGEIAATVEACGGHINAYTSFERTVYYLTMSSEHCALGIDLLSDAIFNSCFEATELEREKEVVIEEMRRALDDPSTLVARKVFEYAFAGSAASRPILGFENELKHFTRDQLLSFYQRWYQPQNMHVVITGAVKIQDTINLIEQYYGPYKNRDQNFACSVTAQFSPGQNIELIKGDYEKPRIELGLKGPHLHHPDVAAVDLACFLLGQGELSLLTRSLRDEKHVCLASRAGLYAPSFAGLISISLIPQVESIGQAISALVEQLNIFVQEFPFTHDDLERAKANLKADKLHEEETIEGQAQSIGYGMSTPWGPLYEELYLRQIESTDLPTVREAAQRWFQLNACVLSVLVHESSSLKKEDITQAFVQNQHSSGNKPCLTTTTKPSELSEAHYFELTPRLKFIYRQHKPAPFFNIVAATYGGLRAETILQPGHRNAIASLLAQATKTWSYHQLMQQIENNAATLGAFSGKDTLGFEMQCLSEHRFKFCELLKDCLFNAVFPQDRWQINQKQILEMIRTQNDSPAQMAMRRLQQRIFGPHPYAHSQLGTFDSMANLDASTLEQEYHQWAATQSWTFCCVASQPVDEVKEMMTELFEPTLKKSRQKIDWDVPAMHTQPGQEHIAKNREQTHIVLGFPGLAWKDSKRYALEVLMTILGGQGGRFFLELRDKQSLCYTVSPLNYFGIDPGLVGAYMASHPDKKQQAITGLKEIIYDLKTSVVSTEELERAKNFLLGSHASEMQRAEAQAMNMALMELYELGYNHLWTYAQSIKQVTQDDLLELAQQLFDESKEVIVSVGKA